MKIIHYKTEDKFGALCEKWQSNFRKGETWSFDPDCVTCEECLRLISEIPERKKSEGLKFANEYEYTLWKDVVVILAGKCEELGHSEISLHIADKVVLEYRKRLI